MPTTADTPTAPITAKRRLFRPRFTLAALLILVTVISPPLAYVAQRRAWNLRRKAAYEALLDKHLLIVEWDKKASAPVRMSGWSARLFLDDQSPRIDRVDFRNIPEWRQYGVPLMDDDVLLLRYFPEIKSIDLRNAEQLTDRGLEVVSQIRSLRQLNISGSPLVRGEFLRRLLDNRQLLSLDLRDLRSFDGKELGVVETFPNLTSISVSHCPLLTDESVAEVDLPSKLTSLSVRNCPLGDHTLSRWLRSRQFESLSIDAPITSKSISQLGEQPQLKSLRLENVPLNDSDFLFLKNCKRLNQLNFDGMPIRGELLSWIGKAETIKHLSLNSTLLEDRYLQHLSRFRGLLNLDLSYTPITGEGFGDVKESVAIYTFMLNDVQLSDRGKDALASLLDRFDASLCTIEFPRNWDYRDFHRLKKKWPEFSFVVNIAVTLEAQGSKEKSLADGGDYDFRVYESQEIDQVLKAPTLDRCSAELMAPVLRLRDIALAKSDAEKRMLEELRAQNIGSMRGRAGD